MSNFSVRCAPPSQQQRQDLRSLPPPTLLLPRHRRHLQALKQTARVWPPAVNQVEFHPYLAQSELLAYCKQHGILCAPPPPVTARRGPVLTSQLILG